MEIVNNAYVTVSAAFYESGGVIMGTQRIPNNHLMEYWQDGNRNQTIAALIKPKKTYYLKDALYVGRICTHFGHFLMEALPRLCDAIDDKFQIIGTLTEGFLPVGIKPARKEDIEWFIKTITNKRFYKIDNQIYQVDRLYIPKLPLVLSQSCSEPWRMSAMIEKIVRQARLENPHIINNINTLYLKRNDEVVINTNPDIQSSNPDAPVSEQIAKVSYAKKLVGKSGSNTHISMFAKNDCYTEWIQRGDFQQTDRNQLICDLVKTFNTFN